MGNLNRPYPLLSLPSSGLFSVSKKRYFIGFCAFWVVIALLEFGQDYISSILNGNAFIVAESLSYKLFWLLFIPLTIALDYSFTKAERFFSGFWDFACKAILMLFITTVHLILFSFILFGISNLIHENPMTLLYLVYEKLSTRLYIALSIYMALSGLYFFVRRRRAQQKTGRQGAQKALTVKNGKRSVVVDIANIKWIGSDGPYLDIHTESQKYVVVDSLKDIIKKLPGNFKRIHKSTIVNIDQITELQSRGNGDYDVIMDDGRVLRLSRNYTKPLKGVLL